MNFLDFVRSDVWALVGWTMLHTIWIGLLLGAVALLIRRAVQPLGAHVRYVVALACLATLALSPLPIAGWVWQSQPVAEPTDANPVAGIADRHRPANTLPSGLIPLEAVELKAIPTDSAPAANRPMMFVAEATVPLSPETTVESTASPAPLATRVLDSIAGYLPWLWLLGTPVTFLLLATGFLGAERLRRQSRLLHEGELVETCRRLAATLKLGAQVSLGICDRITGPILVGIVRPMILLPPAALCHWSPEQLEMVLLHELAHVRRLDNFVNLLQRVTESLLFFVPSLWLVSRWVRREREHCCDAAVVAQTGNAREYAITLAQLADKRFVVDGTNQVLSGLLTSSMGEHYLLTRVRQILRSEEETMKISRPLFGSVLTLLVALVVLLGWYGTNATRAQEKSEPQKVDSSAEPVIADTESATSAAEPVISNESSHTTESSTVIVDSASEPRDEEATSNTTEKTSSAVISSDSEPKQSQSIITVETYGSAPGYRSFELMIKAHVTTSLDLDTARSASKEVWKESTEGLKVKLLEQAGIDLFLSPTQSNLNQLTALNMTVVPLEEGDWSLSAEKILEKINSYPLKFDFLSSQVFIGPAPKMYAFQTKSEEIGILEFLKHEKPESAGVHIRYKLATKRQQLDSDDELTFTTESKQPADPTRTVEKRETDIYIKRLVGLKDATGEPEPSTTDVEETANVTDDAGSSGQLKKQTDPDAEPRWTIVSGQFSTSYQDQTFVTSRRSGVLEFVKPAVGDQVKKGDELASFDKEDLREAELELKIAESKYKSAREADEIAKKLTASAAIGTREARKFAAAAELAELEYQQERLKFETLAQPIVAPMNGTVIEILKKPGDSVDSGIVILRLVNMERFQIDGILDLMEAPKIQPGTPIRFTLSDKYNFLSPAQRVVEGTISSVYPELQAETKQNFRATVNNPHGVLRAGMAGTLEVLQSTGKGREQAAQPRKFHANIAMGLQLQHEIMSKRSTGESRSTILVSHVDPNGPAGKQGIRDGDFLVGLHHWEITKPDHVQFVFNHPNFQSFQPLKFYILREEETLFGHLTLEEDYKYERATFGAPRGESTRRGFGRGASRNTRRDDNDDDRGITQPRPNRHRRGDDDDDDAPSKTPPPNSEGGLISPPSRRSR